MLTRLATRIRDRAGVDPDLLVIGVGATAGSIRDVRRSFLEASQVADVAASRPGGRDPLFYRLPDLRLRGLLHLLRDDSRLQTFVERELGGLLGTDPALIDTLEAYLAAGGNKAEAAKAAHLARPTFYDRLRRIERILGTDLSSAESRTSLHVALLALDAARAASSLRRPRHLYRVLDSPARPGERRRDGVTLPEFPVGARPKRVGLILGALTSCGFAAWAVLTAGALYRNRHARLGSHHVSRATVSDPHPRVRCVAPGGITERQAGCARH
jgi:hypothetical protein